MPSLPRMPSAPSSPSAPAGPVEPVHRTAARKATAKITTLVFKQTSSRELVMELASISSLCSPGRASRVRAAPALLLLDPAAHRSVHGRSVLEMRRPSQLHGWADRPRTVALPHIALLLEPAVDLDRPDLRRDLRCAH